MSERKSDKEMADELDAKDRLTARGYTQQKCQTCQGIGQVSLGHTWTQCYSCDGRGFHWYAPITK